ncbi:MAG: HIT domain-containing protein [Lapillicoccus sp.]
MCLFCDMLEGKVPMDVVRETGQSVAFRDINPQAPTHVLVIPRRHVENLGALAEYPEELSDLVVLGAALAEEHNLEAGYRMVANTGALAGQTVFHAHLHVLGGRRMAWPPG